VQRGLFEALPQGSTRLTSVDPSAWRVHPGWHELLATFWAGAAGQGLLGFLRQRLDGGAVVYPPQPLRALERVSPEAVQVVVLGQDPYHGPGQADGLAFSVASGKKTPPSLRNIFKELQRDQGLPTPACGSLEHWAAQGVLLLNTCLTVEEGQAASHAGRGWETLTDALIRRCSENGSPTAFMLWGVHAQKKRPLIDRSRHQVLCANHPSPLSAGRGPVPFLGCGHFGEASRWLQALGRPGVNWTLPSELTVGAQNMA
jgi:uracil-DNA glycosylase